ncbi:MAG: hypothetical protein IT372_24135 [Polyangiaceae bacterium]|nr:hypothetical protein [Polyangiaceae bacterium]
MSARLLTAAALLGALGLGLGCSGVDEAAVTTVDCPPSDQASFGPVSAVLERHCGTLDCHGNAARPLRIYGDQGLRRPEPPDSTNVPPGQYGQYYPGGTVSTTQAELDDNAAAICGLEPELLAKVRKGEEEPDILTFIRKARLEEKHKGGRLWAKGEAGDQCMIKWLTGPPAPGAQIDTAPCKDPSVAP